MNIKDRIDTYLISSHDKVEFMKNFAIMTEGGVALDETFAMLARGTASPGLKKVLDDMARELGRGASLAEVFSKHEKVFGEICTSVVRVGEASGSLSKSLVFLADYLEYRHDLTQEVRAALIYPKFITTLIFIVAVFLIGVILPKLVPVFSQLHVTLPLSTKILLSLSLFVRTHWTLLLLAVILLRLLWSLALRVKRVRMKYDHAVLALPLFGGLIRNYQLALFTQLFLTLFRSGSPVNEALQVAGEGATNLHYREAIRRIRLLVESGMNFSSAIETEVRLFPNNIIAMVAAGQESGSLDHSFSSLADYYAKEVRLKTKRLPSLIEPILLILIAVVVGFVALSIVLPIYEVTRGITR